MMRTAAELPSTDAAKTRLHSTLQDARKTMLTQHHAFNLVAPMGGSLMKKYDLTSAKMETFVDARYHKELAVKVERDEWEVHSAAAEAVQLLTYTQLQAEWRAIGAARVQAWDAAEVQRWVASVCGEAD